MSDKDKKPANWLIRLFSRPEPEPVVLDEDAQELIDNAAAFDLLRVEDIMVPRADIIAVRDDISLRDLTRRFIEVSHSRLPVYHGTLDDPRGMVHIKDILQFLSPDKTAGRSEKDAILGNIIRPVLYVPASMHADDLLMKMQADSIHMALVIDEYGGTDGLVTLEDLVEQIVGNIEDEHDEGQLLLKKLGPDKWDASARASIEQMEKMSAVDLGTDEIDEDVDTLGGLVFSLAGRVPQRGEIIIHPAGLEFEVMEADPRRIRRLRVRRAAPAKEKKRS